MKTPWLDQLDLPQDLRKLSTAELEAVAREVREYIIQVVTQVGGHLGASLGVVELTVALHALFDSPEDCLVWDVGHQSYPHKVLTGRKDLLPTIRRYQGLSGFPRRAESPHDHFGAGHASTALSAAMGMAMARDLKGEKHHVVAIVGDGALTGGMALEALNNAKNLRGNFIVILNDNEMSISPNVGALSEYFTRIRTNASYRQLKERMERLMSRIPRIGAPLVHRVEILKERLKRFVVDLKSEVIFEELGFKYLGPINGYHLPLLMSALQYAKEIPGPILLHVTTVKGKGYPPAEADPVKYHGVGGKPVSISHPVQTKPSLPTYTSVFSDTMVALAARDPRIVAITAAMREGTGLVEFSRRFPDRFFDVGIAEQHAVTFAGGMATRGMKPVCAIYSTFLQRAYDQVIHDICLQHLDVTFAMDRAGLVGEDGATHHGAFDLAYLRCIPNMVVAAPKDERELQNLLYSLIEYSGPAAIRYPRGEGCGIERGAFTKIPIGKGEIVKEPSTHQHVLLVAVGTMVAVAYDAAMTLEAEGVAVRVINARFIKPLDEALLIAAAESATLILTVEDGVAKGGFGSALLELFNQAGIVKPVHCVGLPDNFVEQGSQRLLREEVGLTARCLEQLVHASLARTTFHAAHGVPVFSSPVVLEQPYVFD